MTIPVTNSSAVKPARKSNNTTLVELGVHVVRAVPVPMDGGVGSHHMIVGEHVPVAEFLDGPAIDAHGIDVGADLGLWEHHADLQWTLLASLRALPGLAA
jgi:hypothetical protein